MVGAASFASVVSALSGASERLRRSVNPVVMTKVALAAGLEWHERFAIRVAREPKIFLMGDAGDFSVLAEDRTA